MVVPAQMHAPDIRVKVALPFIRFNTVSRGSSLAVAAQLRDGAFMPVVTVDALFQIAPWSASALIPSHPSHTLVPRGMAAVTNDGVTMAHVRTCMFVA